jgi:hypothetical protein
LVDYAFAISKQDTTKTRLSELEVCNSKTSTSLTRNSSLNYLQTWNVISKELKSKVNLTLAMP